MINKEKPINNKINDHSVFVVAIVLSFVIFVGIFIYYAISTNNKIKILGQDLNHFYVDYLAFKRTVDSKIATNEDETPASNPMMAYEEVSYDGVIKKEKIPEEYALGDFWYILYFDIPQNMETVNGDAVVNKIEVQPSTVASLEDYLDKSVNVTGRLSYGYAESRIVLVDSVDVK